MNRLEVAHDAPIMSNMPNVMLAAKRLEETLAGLGWDPQLDEASLGFCVDMGAPHVPIASVYAAISPEAEQLVIYFNFGMAAPPNYRDECARLITRANWGLTIGNFEMDYEDGQLRFKSSLDFSGGELTGQMIRNAILPAMNAVDAYAQAIANVILRGQTATEALVQIETNKP